MSPSHCNSQITFALTEFKVVLRANPIQNAMKGEKIYHFTPCLIVYFMPTFENSS